MLFFLAVSFVYAKNGKVKAAGMYIGSRADVTIGQDTVIESYSKTNSNYKAVFEDDMSTGYFYAMDMDNPEVPIQDAVHIYDVDSAARKKIPSGSEFIIAWTKDGLKAVLFINNYPHAVIDFENKSAFCRTGIPQTSPGSYWSAGGHRWKEGRYNQIIYE